MAKMKYNEHLHEKRKRIRFAFKWYDLWIGAYIDSEKRTVYICPLPCCVIAIDY